MRRRRGRNAEFHPDNFARNDEFHPPIELSPFRSVVRGDGIAFSVPQRRDVLRIYTLADQEIAHRIGALFGQLLIQLVSTGAVGVSLDLQVQPGMRNDDPRYFCQGLARRRFQSVLAGIEEDVLHIRDQASGRFPRRQNGIELLQQLLTKLILFGFRLLAETLGLGSSLLGLSTGRIGLLRGLLGGGALLGFLLGLLLGGRALLRFLLGLLFCRLRLLLRRGLPGGGFLAFLRQRFLLLTAQRNDARVFGFLHCLPSQS